MRTQKTHKKKIIIVEFVEYNNFPGKKRVRKKDTFMMILLLDGHGGNQYRACMYQLYYLNKFLS